MYNDRGSSLVVGSGRASLFPGLKLADSVALKLRSHVPFALWRDSVSVILQN